VYYCGGTVMQNVLNKLCLEVGANFNPEDFDAGTTFIPNLEKYFTVRKKEAAIETLKRDVILKRRMSMSDVNGPPGLPNASHAGAMTRSREGSVGSVVSTEDAGGAAVVVTQQAAMPAEAAAAAVTATTATSIAAAEMPV
jgi:hypothetical protein